MADIEVRIPDIGNFADVPVIEIHVAPGDTVAPEDPLVTLESDKATLDVPAPAAGTVSELLVSVGDQVSEGTPILVLQGSGQAAAPGRERVREDARRTPGEPAGYGSPSGVYERIEVTVPDIGDFAGVPVIEVHIAAGDTVAAEDPLITLESDKATMDIPAPAAGTIIAVRVAVGDAVSAGHPIADLETGQKLTEPPPPTAAPAERPARPPLAGRPATCTPRCSCSAPGPAGTRPRSAPPTWASRWSWPTSGRPWAACASTWAASRPRRCCTPRG